MNQDMTINRNITALTMFSGGLDSLLASRLLMAQGIRVRAVKFVSPFFGHELLDNETAFERGMQEKYGLDACIRDVSVKYLQMLRKPAHGFGRNFNPCVDCKILLLSEARRLLAEFGASFLATGEVLGQRPMSQRQDSLRLIERDSGCEGLLLRPLCAKRLKPTKPELEGLVDREQLLAFSGRSRSPQIALAASFGITEFASPAGGCVLTDPILARRIRRFYEEQPVIEPADIRLLLVGRPFRLPHGGLVALGRDEKENEKLETLAQPKDWVLNPAADWPGPTALLRFSDQPEDLRAAAGLVARYSKKGPAGLGELPVTAIRGNRQLELPGLPPAEEERHAWQR
jgi:tRNA-uridine 2-sulfurtransferase